MFLHIYISECHVQILLIPMYLPGPEHSNSQEEEDGVLEPREGLVGGRPLGQDDSSGISLLQSITVESTSRVVDGGFGIERFVVGANIRLAKEVADLVHGSSAIHDG